MKKFFFVVASLFVLVAFAFGASRDSVRKAIAKSLYGKIYYTNSSHGADFTVYVTSHNPDLLVWEAHHPDLAKKPGIWHVTRVQHAADYSVYVTRNEHFADLRIQYVDSQSRAGLPD